jgi:ATP-dependent DNA ligase
MRGVGSVVMASSSSQHACKLGIEGIVSKRRGSLYRSGRSPDWIKCKNPTHPAVRREAEEDWGR